MFPDGLNMSQVVILLEEAVEQSLVRSAPHLAELERLNLFEWGAEGCAVDRNQCRLAALGERVGHDPAHRRELNPSGAMQRQHQSAADHGAQPAVGLHPMPSFAEFLGEATSTRPGVLRDQLPNAIDIGLREDSMSVPERAFHAPQTSNLRCGTQARFRMPGLWF
jgi:hypothetical protein